MEKISRSYELKASPEAVYDALINPDTIQRWSGAPAEVEPEAGTPFSMFGGQIVGTTLEVVPNQKLVQRWHHDTKVTITLTASGEATIAELRHEDIPEPELAGFEHGWDAYYFGPMQAMFEGKA